ncbi:hypothetical protein [Mangrovimonas sp. DI 80]|uniref:hypothetical protein n=1 Tax=Mangrovimonas sp. DI 80 TaxID=1779330 RepID=UPI000977D781|nr:hypothetical protein [Mangrovimonas sp. DI 80]OMP30904.1 hypothetical protein BKM32_11840 [Mangrovimonas sp. DI 80]
MKRDNLDKLFDSIKDDLDYEMPNLGHQGRFLEKLQMQNPSQTSIVVQPRMKRSYWQSALAIAASIIVALGLFTVFMQQPEPKDLASVSPELSETQTFFTAAIEQELATLKSERSPETEKLIDDALKQMEILENKYEALKIDLTQSGDDKRVIYAMISNFQSRIDLLNDVLENIKQVKQLKQEYNENKLTI